MVRHLRQPTLVGQLTGKKMSAVVPMVEVRWGIKTEFVALAVLETFADDDDNDFESIVAKSRYEKIEELRSLMTFEKLSGSLSNVMYSMRTAEIKFFAHQFVPVLKFVNSPLSRLLIADEVGLGKTIEAGLIWTECRARYQARRLLIICPPTLVPKWLRELRNRFSIDAEEATAKDLQNRFERFEKRGPTESFALVTSYHALRPRRSERRLLQPWLALQGTDVEFEGKPSIKDWKPRPALFRQLLEWDGKDPFIDLAVFDEAHLMKNTATANHLVGDVIASSAQAVIALSATPLTNQSRDLYALLRLVDPDMFRSEAIFQDLRRRNIPAVKLASELSKAQINIDRCQELLSEIPESAARDNLDHRISQIGSASDLTADDRIDILGKATRLNELGSFLTRTRKVEIPEHKAVREPVTLTVEPEDEELVFYNAVLSLIRQRVKEKGEMLSLFHLIAPALSMTSCLPLMAEKLRKGESRWGDLDDLAYLDTAYTEDSDDSDFVGENQTSILGDRSWLPNFDFEAADTKYTALKKELLGRATTEKVIIFAFFKGTLHYLKRRLEEDGMRCMLVTGDVKDLDERDQLLQDFAKPEYRILLCSEVAAEGVDLQFCRVMVNYDLPWNPMRVEQRIGRIDRIGQEAKSIVIINFHVKGTIDGSIYTHLHSKIGLFEDTIGDLEGIVGEYVNRLTLELLSNDLTPKQVEARVQQVAKAIALERQQMAAIDQESDTLLGLRSYFHETVTRSRSLGRYIKPSELRLFTDDFFAETYSGGDSCQLNWDSPAKDCLAITFSFHAFEDFKTYLTNQAQPIPKGFNQSTRTGVLTLDPEVHEKLKRKHRNLILANHLHPFVGWMTSTYQHRQKSWHPAAAVKVATGAVPPSVYFYVVMRITLKHHVLSKEELLFRAIDAETLQVQPLTESEALLNDVLDHGATWSNPAGFPDHGDALADALDRLERDCTEIQDAFAEELELRINTKRAQIESHFTRQIETQRRRLESMSQSGSARAQDIAGARTRIGNLEVRFKEELENLDSAEEITPEFKRVACGLIKTCADR
ncbi:helicase-related protein [Luteolibacter soli]|uniref:Helicase-related protein n=1 Tax=Luteolibacter soli TaxID=3135280 RepID=A0ABU9ATH5_9BACT